MDFLTAVFEDNDDAICVRGTDGALIGANRAFRDLFGDGQSIADRTREAEMDVVVSRQANTAEEHLNNRVWSVKRRPVLADTGEVGAVLTRWRDVTQQRRAEQDLVHYEHMVAHELQEPLRVVTAWSGRLSERHDLDEDAQALATRVLDAASRADRMAKAILAWSRIAGRQPKREVVALGKALDRVQEKLAEALAERGGVIIRGELGSVFADKRQLELLLQHLVANALTYCEGPPRVDVWLTRDDDGTSRLFVKDEGIGIPPEYQDRIFELYQRLHSRRRYPGSGIGLAICSRIAARHGGSLTVSSSTGAGATFELTLPAA